MKEYGKKFSQRELRFSDVMDMAKRSQYALTGLVINAFTDSVILDWNQLGTINPGGDDEEEETMYTRYVAKKSLLIFRSKKLKIGKVFYF